MHDEYKFPTALETMPADYWFPKYVMSSLLLACTWIFFNVENPNSGLVCAPLLLLSFMMMSVTRVKPGAESLMYRRLFRWKPLEYPNITGCGTFWILGYVRAKRYIFPWGGIYFVLPRDAEYDYRWDKNIVSFIRGKAGIPDSK
jgi:hypothetical protein